MFAKKVMAQNQFFLRSQNYINILNEELFMGCFQ